VSDCITAGYQRAAQVAEFLSAAPASSAAAGAALTLR